MKKLLSVSLLVLSLVVVGQLRATDPSDWETYAPEGEKFSVRLPGTPVTQTKQQPTPAGPMKMKMHMVQDDATTYGVITVEIPKALRQFTGAATGDTLDGLVSGIAQGAKGKVVSTKKVKLGGHDGREVVLSVFEGAGTARVRAYVTRDRIYMLMIMAPAETDLATPAGYFFGSLKLSETTVPF
jgi:hypothetical protein